MKLRMRLRCKDSIEVEGECEVCQSSCWSCEVGFAIDIKVAVNVEVQVEVEVSVDGEAAFYTPRLTSNQRPA